MQDAVHLLSNKEAGAVGVVEGMSAARTLLIDVFFDDAGRLKSSAGFDADCRV